MTQQDMFTRDFAEAGRLEADMASGRQGNVALFETMFLNLGFDCLKLATTGHDAELAEAKGLAAHRWGRMLDLEAQVQREEAALTSRPKNRPAQPGDETLPDRTLEKRNAKWQHETKDMHAALVALKEQAKRERRELEAFIAKRR